MSKKSKRKDVDWEAVERDWRLGVKTQRQIAAEHGITHTAVQRRAARDGWARDLSDRVAVRARKIVDQLSRQKTDSGQEADGRSKPRSRIESDRDLVESSAKTAAHVMLEHRRDIGQARELTRKLFKKMDFAVEDSQTLADLRGSAIALKALVDSLHRQVELERQAYGIDPRQKVGGESDGGRFVVEWTQS